MRKDILGIFISEYDSAEKAKGVVTAMKNCPHLMGAGTSGNIVSMSFIVPESLRWWFEGPAENPELLGAKKVDVFINPGRFGWDGGFGTSAYADPKEEFAGVLMTQRMMDSPSAPKHFVDFWTQAYAAIA